MKIDISVTNLGKIQESKIKIRPITLLTGPNGTGKSFLTKSLYSILNIVNTNTYHEVLVKDLLRCQIYLLTFISQLSYAGATDKERVKYLDSRLDNLVRELESATELPLGEYFAVALSKVGSVNGILIDLKSYSTELSAKPKKIKSVKSILSSLETTLSRLEGHLKNGNHTYSLSIQEALSDEIKDNFQISNLYDLISFGQEEARIDINEVMHVTLKKSEIDFSLQHDFINKISNLSRVVFFESPAYWKVRDALKYAKENKSKRVYINKKITNDSLTGVPKYFYDLDTSLKTNFKTSSSAGISELADSLEEVLGGEFVFSGDDLVFKDRDTNNSISKNLISFGMTNIGMIHALLKNNVITPGSFVFLDEPETNLHPEWQVLLTRTLLSLADNDINIVMATHSIDMLKALEVGLKKRKDIIAEDFLSVHYLDTDGKLLEFDSEKPEKQLVEARTVLSSSYESLYIEGLK